MDKFKLQGKKPHTQKKWLLITAEYRGDLYVVDEMQCLGSGAIYPTSFKNFNFSPDSDHVTNINMKCCESKEEFDRELKLIEPKLYSI
ncbi:hypothetical protein [Tenacibaculum ovolyticum]|uniref:hypothetical protein n=1 Tax=Tenacibaculum ovolyticum TaxID=104270 RepID=UPI0007ED44D7|nr:hypothetical protein [Tenacibaculum ovolyticum]